MTNGYFFGYGSLVNRRTHAYADARTARLGGWRRTWHHTDLRPVAFLSVIPDAATEIDGLIARVDGNWADLDHRERAYDRVTATDVAHDLGHSPPIAVYAIPEGRHGRPDSAHPVLLSYLDTVVQGFLDAFGEAGVTRFFETTDGWDAPIADDRARPLYPRATTLAADELGLVDRHLADLGCTLCAPPDLGPSGGD